MPLHAPASGGKPLPATLYERLKTKGATDGASPDEKIIRFCQVPPKPKPALLVQMVALPNLGKSTTLGLLGDKLTNTGYLTFLTNNSALEIFHDLRGLGDEVSLSAQARLMQYASIFRVMVSEIRELRHRANVILVEHYSAFFSVFESSLGGAAPESAGIIKNALRGVPPADLTFYLTAPPSLAIKRERKKRGRLSEDDFISMYRSFESLADQERWHRIPVLGREREEISNECLRVIVDRLNARFHVQGAVGGRI